MTTATLANARIRITAFDWVPDFAQGNVRDIRIRWALEEAELAYEAIILDQGSQNDPENIARQPFGQVPAIEIDGRTMFESGAIVWTIAEGAGEALLPNDEWERRSCLSWVLASLNSVEPALMNLAELDFFVADEAVKRLHRPYVVEQIELRLGQLCDALDGREHLVGDRFTAADLMMTAVLRIARHTNVLSRFPTLDAYVARHLARPAHKRALEAQLRPFGENAAKYETAG